MPQDFAVPPTERESSVVTADKAATERSQSPRRRGRPKMDIPNPIDVRVGARLRLRRNMLGLSQEKLGKAIGLTYQQVQKYERGMDRIGASRLYELSRVLDVPVSFFFTDTDPVRKRETLELVRAYFAIADATVRRHLCDLVKALAEESNTPAAESPARAVSASR